MSHRLWTGLLIILLAATSTSAVTVRAKFNPGGWFTSASIDYWFTIDPSDPITGPGPATARMDIDLGSFPLSGGSVTTSGPSSFLNGSLSAGPPQVLSLWQTGLALKAGDSVHVNSGANPNSVIGFGNDVTWSVLNIAGDTFLPFAMTKTTLPPPGPAIGPVFVAAPAVGDAVLTGTGDPGSYISIFQDNPLLLTHGGPLDPTIRLAFGQVDPAGNFVLPLDSPLTSELLAVGVSETNLDIPEGGEIIQYLQPVPEPGTALLIGLIGTTLVARRQN